jgi:zinc and cadmium transporter
MSTLFLIIIATAVISLLAFVGIFSLSINKDRLDSALLYLVAFAAGALMGGAFLHLLPESIESSENIELVFAYFLIGFIAFFLIEKYLHWRHCHKENCDIHAFSYLSLVGDGIHNFIDGLIIAVSFLADPALGVSTSIAIAAHEIPQELGDFAILVYGGFSRKKALLLNFIVAMTAIVGGVIGYFLSTTVEGSLAFLMPIAAGGFTYIAAADLLPELRKIYKPIKSLKYIILFIVGILFLWIIKFI